MNLVRTWNSSRSSAHQHFSCSKLIGYNFVFFFSFLSFSLKKDFWKWWKTLSWQRLMIILKAENSDSVSEEKTPQSIHQYQIHTLLPGFESLYIAFPSWPAVHFYPVISCIFLINSFQPAYTPHYPLNICHSFPALLKLFLIPKMSMYNLVNFIWTDFFP